MKRDNATVDLDASYLVVSDSKPALVGAVIKGNLSDPCHHLRVTVSPPDENNHINLEVYSVYDPKTICITVIQPFSASIPLGSYSGGHYAVYVNGELLSSFDA
jgi:hypothetical protein